MWVVLVFEFALIFFFFYDSWQLFILKYENLLMDEINIWKEYKMF